MAELAPSWDSSSGNALPRDDICCELSTIEGGVYILTLNVVMPCRFSPEAIQLIDQLLDQVLRDENACALITTNQGKFFSNGMDVSYLKRCDKERALEYLLMFQRLLSKLLTFCLPTIAVIRGHTVGAGCLFALAHDYRLMSSDHGYIFMNEVDLGMSLMPGLAAVLRARLHASTFQEVILTGKRYGGKDALKDGIVQATWPNGTILLQEGTKKDGDLQGNFKRA